MRALVLVALFQPIPTMRTSLIVLVALLAAASAQSTSACFRAMPYACKYIMIMITLLICKRFPFASDPAYPMINTYSDATTCTTLTSTSIFSSCSFYNNQWTGFTCNNQGALVTTVFSSTGCTGTASTPVTQNNTCGSGSSYVRLTQTHSQHAARF